MEKRKSVFDDESYKQGLTLTAYDLVLQIKNMRRTQSDAEIYREVLVAYDGLIKQSGLFETASCNKGCSFCCHDTIIVSEMEIEHIKNVIALKGITPNAERLAKQKENDTAIKWADKACSLLSEPNAEGKRDCLIYEDRPLICRSHNSMEDPKYCNKSVYPNRGIQEGRPVELDALAMSLIMVDVPKGQTSYKIALHDIL